MKTITKEALTDLIAQGLSGTYHCTRVWSAWGVGTMSENDFAPVDESETPGELADAVLAMLAAQHMPSQEAWLDKELGGREVWVWPRCVKLASSNQADASVGAPDAMTGLLAALRGAEQWISTAPHGDNCFVSGNYEGNPGDRCNCGRDEVLEAIQAAIDKATGKEGGAA